MISWNVGGLNSCITDADFLTHVHGHDLIFLCETWQKVDSSFSLQNYKSVSIPRPESMRSKRGHGGICLFYKSELDNGITILKTDKNGMLCIKPSKCFLGFTTDIYMCFVYIPPNNSVYFNKHNVRLFEQLEQIIRCYSGNGKVIVMGDLNARCGERSDFIETNGYEEFLPTLDTDNFSINDIPHRFTMDKTINSSGIKLLDVCRSSDLKIVNGRIGDDAGIGSYTFLSPSGRSLIDYVLMPVELFAIVGEFIVHDIQACSAHAPIQLNLVTGRASKHSEVNEHATRRICWDTNKVSEFRELIESEINNIEELINNIITSEIDIDSGGIGTISINLYNKAFKV